MITTGTKEPSDDTPCYNIISPPTVKANIDYIFGIDNEDFKKELSKQPYICIAADVWSNRHRSYMGVTSCYLNENFEPISQILCCRRFKNPHTSDRISELIHSITEEFGITKSVIACVTDNAANFVRSFKDHGISINDFTAMQIATEIEIDDLDLDDLCEEVSSIIFV